MANMEKIEDRPTWNNMSTPKVMERMENLYTTSKWHDCVFKLFKSDGSGEELVFAHSLVLASSSPVFEALCFGPMAEESPISVPDVDPFAFHIMLKFIYTDTVEFPSVEAACNVLYAAKKYLIYTLAGLAISYISYHINESNCLQIHDFAKYVHEDKLVKEAWSYLCSHLDDVLKYFTEESLSNDLITALVSEEALNGGELIVFKICHLWAEAECRRRNLEINGANLRKLLIQMDILNKIRLLTLTQKEFEDGPVKSGILEQEEIEFIKKIISGLNQIKILCAGTDSNNPNKSNVSDKVTGKSVNAVQDSVFAEFQKKLGDRNFFPVSVSNVVEPRRKIPLKQVYCHRFIEKKIRPTVTSKDGLKITTVVTANKSVRLTGIYLNAKILPIPQLNSVFTHTCVIERDYKEKLVVTICDSSDNTLSTVCFSETVSYGTVFKIPLPSLVMLERLQEYKIKVDLFNSIENYIFGIRNSVSKFPSGLCIMFREQASVTDNGTFVEANNLGIVSGLELCM